MIPTLNRFTTRVTRRINLFHRFSTLNSSHRTGTIHRTSRQTRRSHTANIILLRLSRSTISLRLNHKRILRMLRQKMTTTRIIRHSTSTLITRRPRNLNTLLQVLSRHHLNSLRRRPIKQRTPSHRYHHSLLNGTKVTRSPQQRISQTTRFKTRTISPNRLTRNNVRTPTHRFKHGTNLLNRQRRPT